MRERAEPPIVQPWLRLECDSVIGYFFPEEGAALRDALASQSDPASRRLAEVIDSAVTVLLAAPGHAGTRRVRIASDERSALLEGLRLAEANPLDRFAKLRRELETPPAPAAP
jgi:hypothetical protein